MNEKIVDVINEFCEEYYLEKMSLDNLNQTFIDCGFDSLDFVELLMHIEDKLDVCLEDDVEVSHHLTLGKMIEVIKRGM